MINYHPPFTGHFAKSNGFRGIALVAVLAILVVLAILAASFSALMSIERRSANITVAKVQADLCAKAGLEHAISLLRSDYLHQPAWDDETEEWRTSFTPLKNNVQNATDIDGLKDELNDGRWIYIRNSDGTIIGRYAVLVEDENSKINVNAASAVSTKMQNHGVGTFETLLTDGNKRGLPLSKKAAKQIMNFRYGKDKKPGQANVDDNLTESEFQSDEIDNDGDGIIDESDEGIDDPQEYNPLSPQWDDKAFSSIHELTDTLLGNKKNKLAYYKYLRKYATTETHGRDIYWDERDKTWKNQVNLNTATKKQVHKIVKRANEISNFEPSSKNLRSLTANIIDYHDENNVLSTLGSEYGVEAICFNEVMANDGSYSLEAEGFQPTENWDKYKYVHRLGIWYNVNDTNWKYGWPMKKVGSSGGGARTVITNGISVRIPHTTTVELKDDMVRSINNFKRNDFKKIIKSIGGVPDDLWKNSWLKVYQGRNSNPEYIYYPIIGNKGDILTVGYDDNAKYTYAKLTNMYHSIYNSTRIDNLWRPHMSAWCAFPHMSDMWSFPIQYDAAIKPKDNLYYYVYVGEQNFDGNIGNQNDFPFKGVNNTPWKGYNKFLDVDGDPQSYSESEMIGITEKDLKDTTMEIPQGKNQIDMLRWAYQDGEPLRSKDGFLNVTLSTCKDTGYVGGMNKTSDRKAFENKSTFDVVYIMRPDVIELINISDKPISLKNWKVIINTGSYADQVGLIESATHYSLNRHSYYDDPNPAIPANGYFYLTNNRQIFDSEYGTPKDGSWGTSAQEKYPCFELPDVLWGVRYEITSIKNNNRLVLKDANWKKDQMKYEMAEIQSPNSYSDRNGPTGIRKSVYKSGRNWIDAQSFINWNIDGVKPGDSVLIVGMPREGGFLSMTLRNEYNQIVSRTVEYGSTKPSEMDYSTEKYDPTHYTWVKSAKPTFGGTEAKAHNNSFPRRKMVKPHIKNNPFSTIGEIQKVRKAEDWENIGTKSKGKASTRALKAIAQFFTTAGIRLDPEEKGVHISGWKPAYGTVVSHKGNRISCSNVKWEPGIWKGHTLRMNSGKCKGERFSIINSTANSITVDGYSVPGGKQLMVNNGDKFSVGPGYTTPFFYTQKESDEGIWEWNNKGLEKVDYGLYIYGLNDSISTTEFLEENNNVELDIAVYNYKTKKYDSMPILGNSKLETGKDDPYNIVKNTHRHKYEKSDGFYCGMIHKEHISSTDGVKIKIIPHNTDNAKSSGFAWFDYAYLTPGTVNGKININTASVRVLSALNSITPKLANNIFYGINNNGQKKLKPYKNIADVLNVNGITPEIFGKICSLITTRSDQFRIIVVAESLRDNDNNGEFNLNEGDKILSQSKIEQIVDRSILFN